MKSKGRFPLYVSICVKRTLLKLILMREPWRQPSGVTHNSFRPTSKCLMIKPDVTVPLICLHATFSKTTLIISVL